ncbi:unnamed protein product, partial [Rotaria sordida]
MNDENNYDGESYNRSWNCYIEDSKDDPHINKLRDGLGRTQCKFTQKLIRLRHQYPVFFFVDVHGFMVNQLNQQHDYAKSFDVFNNRRSTCSRSSFDRQFIDNSFYIIFNGYHQYINYKLPDTSKHKVITVGDKGKIYLVDILIMSKTVEPLAEFLPVADVQVGMSKSEISSTTISTDCLGPCVAFLLHFRRGNTKSCFLTHYSFDDDESDLPVGNILVLMLNYICDNFKTKTGITPLETDSETSILHLLVAGGAKKEADKIKNTLAQLNYQPWNIKDIVINPDDFY